MKRASHIIESITLADVRREAARVASEHPFRRRRAQRFLEEFERCGPALLAEIRTGSWQPEPVRVADILEHGKLRHIEIPSFHDMLLQRVLFYPRLERIFINHTWPHSFSSIPGRGPLKAAKHAARAIRRPGGKWCLYFDVRKYYAHINLEILKADVRTLIKDPAVLRLIDRAIDMGGGGLAIGNTASHFLANLYLTPVARQIAALNGVSDVVVYMDNVFVFSAAKRKLHTARRRIVALLAARGLTMKADWQVFRTDRRAVKIGGFCVRASGPWRIYRATFRHLRRVLRRLDRRITLRDARTLASLKGWITHAGCQSFYSAHIRNPWHRAGKVLKHAR